MIRQSRRDFLKSGATVAGLCFVGPSTLATKLYADDAAPSERLMPFPLSSVRLAAGVFKEQEEINAKYLDSLASDRLLHTFRLTAGISSSATPYRGW